MVGIWGKTELEEGILADTGCHPAIQDPVGERILCHPLPLYQLTWNPIVNSNSKKRNKKPAVYLIEGLSYVNHYSKHFTWIGPFLPQNNLM